MINLKEIYARSYRLLGPEAMKKMSTKKVIIFGVGGVGSWVAEGLLRTGVYNITIVDADKVAISNFNRQLMATSQTVGQPKVLAMKERLLDINPDANIVALQEIYTAENSEKFHLEDYDIIVDAIDSLKDKAALILNACKTKAYFISSMGAALKIDPQKIKVDEFWKVKGCPLARALRGKFKHFQTYPDRKFLCVYSDELLENKGIDEVPPTEKLSFTKAQINGSLVHITAIYGFMITGNIIKEICLE